MPLVVRQGSLNFSSGYKLQTLWGMREAAIFSLEGVGATLLAGFLLLDRVPGVALGVLLIALAVVLLLSHLGHPRKALLALRAVGRSWISTGTAVIGASMTLGIVVLLARVAWNVPPDAWWLRALGWLLVVAALFILAYPGFVLSASPAIPFWNTGLLPLLSGALGLSSGLLLMHALSSIPPVDTMAAPRLDDAVLLMLAILASIVGTYVVAMRLSVAAAGESARRLLREEARMFWLLACGAGIALPALLVALATSGGPAPGAMLILAAVAKIVGDVALRYAIIKVGMFDPVI